MYLSDTLVQVFKVFHGKTDHPNHGKKRTFKALWLRRIWLLAMSRAVGQVRTAGVAFVAVAVLCAFLEDQLGAGGDLGGG